MLRQGRDAALVATGQLKYRVFAEQMGGVAQIIPALGVLNDQRAQLTGQTMPNPSPLAG